MKIRTVNNGQIGIIELKSSLISEDIINELRDAVADFIEQGNKKLIIDLSKVNLINSIGLGSLISAYTTFTKSGGEIILTGVGKSVKNVFIITKLTEVFEICDKIDEAIKKFSLIKV
ncbi:MAG: hypothetical protein IGBAC_2172 [Ignavibacteriae bacterium]|nr:MAG: hypothetical protein IGBAC_2172 [Ignavibacteriota bacterium]